MMDSKEDMVLVLCLREVKVKVKVIEDEWPWSHVDTLAVLEVPVLQYSEYY